MRISCWLVCFLLGACQPVMADFSAFPKKSQPYLSLLKKISDNPSREAALTEQESAWNVFARSPYAKGLRQFTDATGTWLARSHCSHLGSYQPYNSDWSLRCGVIYVQKLQDNNKYGPYCNNRKIAEQEYNGGAWVIWELLTARTNRLHIAKKVCGTRLFNGRKRAGWACKENYEYPERISKRQIKYKALGGQLCLN